MNLPHEKYIQAMICGNMPLDGMLEECERWSFPFPIDDDMNNLRDPIMEKDPDFFSKKTDRINRDIIDDLEITPMVTYLFQYGAQMNLEGVEGSFKLLENDNVRVMMYGMILAGMTTEEIELTINEKFDNLNASSEAVDSFKHYFFNLRTFSYKDKQQLEKTFITGTDARRLFKIALKGDKDYMLWKFNAAPKRSLDSMLTEMLNDSFYMFKEKAKSDADIATKFGALALKLSDKLDRIQDVQNKADDIFADLTFETKDNNELADVFNPPTSEDLELDTQPVFLLEPKASEEAISSIATNAPVDSDTFNDENYD